MAVKLPDYTALGVAPDIRPTASVISMPNATAVPQAEENLGATAEKAVYDTQDMLNKAAVTDAMANQYQPKVRELATNFYSLQGKAALDAAPQFAADMAQARTDAGSNLIGQAAQQFQAQALPIEDRELYRSSEHAGEQARVYAKDSNDASIENHITDFSSSLIADPGAAADERTLALATDANFQKSIGSSPDMIKYRQNNINSAFDKAQQGVVQQKLLSLPGKQQQALVNTAVHGTPVTGAPNAAPTQQDPIINTVMTHLEGSQLVQNDNGHGPSKYGIVGALNGLTPQQTADLTPDQAKQIYINNYWKPAGIDNLPDNMKMVAFDTAVQFGVGTAKGMIAQANGDPQTLLDIRSSAYKNLVEQNPDKYGDSAQSWQNRTATLSGMIGQPVPSGQAVANPKLFGVDVDPSTLPKLMEIANLSRERDDRLQAQSDENTAKVQQQTMNKYVEGKSDINNLLQDDSLNIEQKMQTLKVYNTFNRADKNTTENSSNGYDTLMRTLEPNDSDHPNRIVSQTHLDKLLTTNDAAGINVKDYQDAKQAIELDPTIKQALSKNMHDITYANGNVDGKGQQRAIEWYNQTLDAWNKNQGAGNAALSPAAFSATIGEKDGPPMPPPPSRMQQISNWASSFDKGNESTDTLPTFASPSDEAFTKLPSGAKFLTSDGKTRVKK